MLYTRAGIKVRFLMRFDLMFYLCLANTLPASVNMCVFHVCVCVCVSSFILACECVYVLCLFTRLPPALSHSPGFMCVSAFR